MTKVSAVFPNKVLPYLLVTPQLTLTIIFFIWPSLQALYQSFTASDPFGVKTRFVGLKNFRDIFTDPYYWHSVRLSFVFALQVSLFVMAVALLLAFMAKNPLRGATVYKVFLLWPYALAPVTTAILWVFMFQPSIGIVATVLRYMGLTWNHTLHGGQALLLLILASVWKQIGYNFVFFLAALHSVPKSFLEAAAVDGASSSQIFTRILFPLASPTTFFLLVMNVIFSFFDTFGIIDTLTKGGPAKATETMCYRLFVDGFKSFLINRSAAQSAVLMLFVMILTALQFRFLQHRVHYE